MKGDINYMAELSDVISTVETYKTTLNNLNSQIDSIKGYLSDMGINVDTVKVSDLMKYFSDDNYNHSIEPNVFTLNSKKCTTTLPLTADLVDEGLKFRNPSNPSEILTGTYKPYAATAIFTFNLKDMNQSEASFSFNYPELIGQPDVTVYPKEIVFVGPDGEFLLYRNSNFGLGMSYGVSKMTNFVVKKQRYYWDGTGYKSGWCSQQGESLSYYDHSTKMMHLLFPDEAFCMEMIDTEWQVFTCFDYAEPTESNEPKAVPTYSWSGAELTISDITPADYATGIRLVDNKIYASNDTSIAISKGITNTSYNKYGYVDMCEGRIN